MTLKFSSKEIHFLKSETDDHKITPPADYFCDLILSETEPLLRFEKRLEETEIPGESFLCAIMKISKDISDVLKEKIKTTFEDTFNQFLEHERGLWEYLGKMSFIFAYWDYTSETKASELIVSIKERLSAALKTDILIGVSKYPYHDFNKLQTCENALKAIDHAAFFGQDTLIHFDQVSLNISGDRFYHLNQFELAKKDYIKGLEIKPKDINLINSLGVCHGITGELEQAKIEFEKAMKLNPKEAMVVHNIGLLHQIDGDLDKAVIYLKKAHSLDENIFEVELLLGFLLLSQDKTELALPHIDKALSINNQSNAAHRMKGEVLLDGKHYNQAAQSFNQAIKSNPSDAVSLSGYAQCLEVVDKNLTIARSFAKKSISLDPGNSLFKERLARIQAKIDIIENTNQIKSA